MRTIAPEEARRILDSPGPLDWSAWSDEEVGAAMKAVLAEATDADTQALLTLAEQNDWRVGAVVFGGLCSALRGTVVEDPPWAPRLYRIAARVWPMAKRDAHYMRSNYRLINHTPQKKALVCTAYDPILGGTRDPYIVATLGNDYTIIAIEPIFATERAALMLLIAALRAEEEAADA